MAVLDSDEEEYAPAKSSLKARAKVESDDSDEEFKPPSKTVDSDSENETFAVSFDSFRSSVLNGKLIFLPCPCII
jgi:hypothetical protein